MRRDVPALRRSRPRLLDLYCGAGGAALGYHLAGFDVVGVDVLDQPRYPFTFVRADALDVLADPRFLSLFSAIHASPPCQAYSDLRHLHPDREYPDLIEATRAGLIAADVPYVIENVDTAPLIDSITLCGTMFPPLRVIRHRRFESSVPLTAPPHPPSHPLVRTWDKRKAHYGRLDESAAFLTVTGGGNASVKASREAMGIPWMTKAELNEAIPPPYTEYIGRQVWQSLARAGVA